MDVLKLLLILSIALVSVVLIFPLGFWAIVKNVYHDVAKYVTTYVVTFFVVFVIMYYMYVFEKEKISRRRRYGTTLSTWLEYGVAVTLLVYLIYLITSFQLF